LLYDGPLLCGFNVAINGLRQKPAVVVVVSVGAKPIFWTPLLQRPLHKRKGGQVRFSNDQTLEMEKKFDSQKYLSPLERRRLAKSLQLTERQV